MKSLTKSSIVLATILAIGTPWGNAQTATPAPTEKTVKITGSVGLPGAVMRGFPNSVMTDENGHYSAGVPLGWSGTVTPAKEGYNFSPHAITYTKIERDQDGENYAAIAITFTIAGNAGAPGVVMQGLPDNPVADAKGNYNVKVPYRWSGVVAPKLPGSTFSPPAREYPALLTDRLKQDYRIAGPGDSSGGSYPSSSFYSQDRRLPGAAGLAMAQYMLVIPTVRMNGREVGEVADDMRVMLQILRAKANEQRAGMGRTVLPDYGPIFGQGGLGTEALYIQGHAAVFVMEVDFSLDVRPEPNAAGPAGPQRESDSVWQMAKERLGQNGSSGAMNTPNPIQLKEDLIRALRHAANIRHLDPNELIILTVIGTSRPTPMPGTGFYGMGAYGTTSIQGGGYSYGAGSFNTDDASGSSDSGGYTSYSTRGGRRVPAAAVPADPSGGDTLIIQAKKADIDAFAKDQISFEQFSQRVKVFKY
jgi:hypothetical protein